MMTFFPVAEQTFALPNSLENKGSTAFSVCTESTAGDTAEFDLSSDAACSDSSSSLQQETEDEESGDQWTVDVKNTFIDVRSRCDSSRQRRRSVPASMDARLAH